MLTFSFSQISQFMRCNRAWELGYHQNLELDYEVDNLIFGNAFHTGIANYLATKSIPSAVHAMRNWLKEKTIKDKVTMVEGTEVIDREYYDMMQDIDAQCTAMLNYYLPKLGIGIKYRVATMDDVFGVEECLDCDDDGEVYESCDYCGGEGFDYEYECDTCDGTGSIEETEDGETQSVECPDCAGEGECRDDCFTCDGEGELYVECSECKGEGNLANESLMIEYKFNVKLHGAWVTGYIDAILVDLETDELVIVDWKTRKAVLDEDACLLDGQLHLYAAALAQLEAKPISSVCMWQFRKETPKPAKMNKNGSPSISAQSTTWEHWLATQPHADISKVAAPKGYESWAAWGEVRTHSVRHFMHPVFGLITERANELAWENVQRQANLMVAAKDQLEAGHPLAASMNMHSCNPFSSACPFRRLCNEALRYGDDPSFIIEQDYRQKTKH